MFWILSWCVAVTCSPFNIETGVAGMGYLHAPHYKTQEECVAVANRDLEKYPQRLFMCQQNPAQGGELIMSADGRPERPGVKTIYIGPRTLSY